MVKKPKQELIFNDPTQVNIVEQNRKDLQSYAEEVVSNRAVVSIYGFKPVHMLLIYCAYAKTGMNNVNRTIKCARLVGDMLGVFHPHGDASTYEAILTLVNWYDCYIPLFKKQGNFGSFQGDGPASYRYTETTLSEFALDCIIGDLKETSQVVDWIKNYDGSVLQPLYLPIKVPILLINGTDGIAVGMKADIPSHNLNEVIDATIKLIDDPNYQVTLIPDHCMSCEIVNTNWKSISNSGCGTYTIRAKIEEGEYGGCPALFIVSLPNKTRLDPIKASIENLKLNGELPQILGIYEDCTPTQLSCIVKFRKGTNLNYAKQVLYKKTNLQKNCRVNFQIYDPVNHKIIRLSYKAYLEFFIEFRKNTLFRLYSGLYQEKITKVHALQMYIELASNTKLDQILRDVRSNTSMNDNELIEFLITHYNLTDLQASFVIKNDISKISPYHISIYKDQLAKLAQETNTLYTKIIDENELVKEIKNDLIRIKQKYGSPRRCKVIKQSEVDGIPEGEFKVLITDNNFISKIESNSQFPKFKNQKLKFVLSIDNRDNVLIFDNKGKVYKLPVSKISVYDNRSNGIDIRILIKDMTSNIVTIIPESKINELSKRLDKHFYLISVSRQGYIKRMEIPELLGTSVRGSVYSKVDTEDNIQDIIIVPNTVQVIAFSHNRAVRFPIDEIPVTKKSSKGLQCMKYGELVDGVSLVTSSTTHIVVITQKGYVNKFRVEGFPPKSRRGEASKIGRFSQGDYIFDIFGLSDKDSIKLTTGENEYVYKVSDLEESSSLSTGVRLINNREIVIKAQLIK